MLAEKQSYPSDHLPASILSIHASLVPFVSILEAGLCEKCCSKGPVCLTAKKLPKGQERK